MPVDVTQLTETRYIKHQFNNDEIIELTHQMLKAESAIEEKEAEVKTFTTQAKADIARYEAEITGCKEKIRSGYENIGIPCTLKYEEGFAIYFKKGTGEIIEKRPMTDQEQMKLSGGFTDAEQIIRADSEKQMDGEVIASFGGVDLVKPGEGK